MKNRGGRLVALELRGARFAAALDEVWGAGDCALPLPPGLPPAERARILQEMRPEAVIDEGGESLLPGGEGIESGVAAVVLTSGTAGPPKGVELTHEALNAAAKASSARLGVNSGDRWLLCVPPERIAGLSILVRSRLIGRAPAILARFDVGGFEAAEASLVSLVPTMLVRLLDAGADLTRWRRILLGGGPAPPGLLQRAGAAGANVVTTYGMTETCGGCVYDGAPLDGVEVRVGVDGAISLRGPILMRGYRRGRDLTHRALKDGWFHTSDVGAWSEDGRLRVLGRADEAIITGGLKVWPAVAAARLAEHPEVAEAAVFGRPDLEWGRRVVAVIVPRDQGASPGLAELRDFVAEAIERHNAPKELITLPEIPRLPSGKLDLA
ncbi:MAG: AMP-binding protein, partial [Actinobacteria bacterium]|nr:AMP-binding protein [Actinomycetota bacterium]